MRLISGTTVEVTRRVPSGTDRFGAETFDAETETVEDVLPQPYATTDVGEGRPEGATVQMRFHFPKTYTRSLKGCLVTYGGRTYRVVGDPQPLLDENTPGPWNRVVGTEAVDG